MTQTPSPQSRYERFRKYYRSIEPMLGKPKNRIYTAVIFSFLAISLFAWYAILPTIRTILLLRREIVDKTQVNEQMEQKITNLIEAQVAYQEAQNYLPFMDEAMPHNSEPIDVVHQLRNLTNNSGATISSMRVGGVPLLNAQESTRSARASTKQSQNGYGISMVLIGPYSAIEAVLHGINTMRRIVTIDTISIAESLDEAGLTIAGKQLKLTMQLKTYFKP